MILPVQFINFIINLIIIIIIYYNTSFIARCAPYFETYMMRVKLASTRTRQADRKKLERYEKPFAQNGNLSNYEENTLYRKSE